MKLILYIVLFILTINLFPQNHDTITSIKLNEVYLEEEDEYDGPVKVEVINTSELKYKLVYDQYYSSYDSLLIHNYDSILFYLGKLRINCEVFYENTDHDRFYFRNNSQANKYLLYDILTLNEDTFSLDYNKKAKNVIRINPFFTSEYDKNVTDSIFGWNISIKFVRPGCLDTQTYTAVITTRHGELIFKDHNNMRFYANKGEEELYLLSTRNCRNQFLLYKIYK